MQLRDKWNDIKYDHYQEEAGNWLQHRDKQPRAMG